MICSLKYQTANDAQELFAVYPLGNGKITSIKRFNA